MDDELSGAGKLVIIVGPEGVPTGVGYFHKWGSPDMNRFRLVSEHSVAWDEVPSDNIAKAVHGCLGIPVVEQG